MPVSTAPTVAPESRSAPAPTTALWDSLSDDLSPTSAPVDEEVTDDLSTLVLMDISPVLSKEELAGLNKDNQAGRDISEWMLMGLERLHGLPRTHPLLVHRLAKWQAAGRAPDVDEDDDDDDSISTRYMDEPQSDMSAPPTTSDAPTKSLREAIEWNVSSSGSVLVQSGKDRPDKDVYLRRGAPTEWGLLPKGMRSKTWEDAQTEFDALGETPTHVAPKSLDDDSGDDTEPDESTDLLPGTDRVDVGQLQLVANKYRKMVVRSVTAMDQNQIKIETVLGTGRALHPGLRAKVDASGAALDGHGPSDPVPETERDEYRDVYSQLIGLEVNLDATQENARDVADRADATHDASAEIVAWSDQVNAAAKTRAAYEGPAARSLPVELERATAERMRARVEQALQDRKYANDKRNDAKEFKAWMAKQGLITGDWWKKQAEKGAAMAKTGTGELLSDKMTAGLMTVDPSSGKRSLTFDRYRKDFAKVRAECAQIEATGAYGAGTKTYTRLKMLADFGLPVLRKVANAIAGWALAATLFTGGAGLGVAAGAGTLSLLLSALKGTIELVLTIWSAVKVEAHTDRDARALRTARVERRKHAVEMTSDVARTVMASTLATGHGKSGEQMSPGKIVKGRFTDFDNDKGVQYGDLEGLGGLGKVAAGTESLVGAAGRHAGKGAFAAKDGTLGSHTETDTRVEERDTKTRKTIGASSGMGRAAQKAAGGLDHVAGSMAGVAAKDTRKGSVSKGDAGDVQGIADDLQKTADALSG